MNKVLDKNLQGAVSSGSAGKSPYLEQTLGRRKTAVARLYIKMGTGKITINKQSIDEYYLRPTSKMVVRHPLVLTDNLERYDINVNVAGGGLHGQAGAISHALSRALAVLNPEDKDVLKKAGLLTRDARIKERKLPGQPGARRKFQFSKR